jgi:hypothetical protein
MFSPIVREEPEVGHFFRMEKRWEFRKSDLPLVFFEGLYCFN